MPLSKARDRERKRLIRLHKAISPPQESKPVQPSSPFSGVIKRRVSLPIRPEIDADGNVIPDGYDEIIIATPFFDLPEM